MSETPQEARARRSRLRWITLGEAVAIAALIISALGLWRSWHEKQAQPTTKIVEERPAIPLALRGKATDDGRSLEISPIESSHALESLTITVPVTKSTIQVGSDGELNASEIESALGKHPKKQDGAQRLRVRIDTRYVEAGKDKRASGNYVLTYRWEGGGLFGGSSVRLTGLSR